MSSQHPHQPKAWIYDDTGRVVQEYNLSTNQEITMDIKSMSTAELVAEYNKLTGKSIKKFSSRQAGEQQVANARVSTDLKNGREHAVEKSSKQPKQPKQPKANKPASTAAESIADSWKDKSVAAARSTKNKVKVGGEVYRSVAAAFEALKLPMSKHIAFRAKLKQQGRATFEGHTFTVVPAEGE